MTQNKIKKERRVIHCLSFSVTVLIMSYTVSRLTDMAVRADSTFPVAGNKRLANYL